IEQKVNTPIVCSGYTLFPDGALCYFRAEESPTKHHVMQIWQTPFISGNILPSAHQDSYLYKVGNKDIVKAMAESQEVLMLSVKEDTYGDLYSDLARKCTDVIDSYYWIDKSEAFDLRSALVTIRETATAAIEEYEKKIRIKKNTTAEIQRVQEKAETLFEQFRRQSYDSVAVFVHALAELRALRGALISLKDLRYTDLPLIESLEEESTKMSETLSSECIAFLLQEDALAPYVEQIEGENQSITELETAKQAQELEARVDQIGSDLELLIDIVSNLKIEDATQTTRIIENISAMYARLNQVKAEVKQKQKSLVSTEAVAEFNAQLKLLDQGIINYLDISDTPQKCDDYLTKLMVQLEELEGKFAEFDEFILQITEKREEIYGAFDSRKNALLEARNNRTTALQKAAERILKGIRNRVKAIQDQNEINGFFAADLMIEKVRDIIRQLQELEDSNKANNIQTQLKTLKEEAIRQLRDRQDLFVDGHNVIRLGKHQFSVNVQPLDLTVVQENGKLYFHLTGSDFFLEITDPALLETRSVWQQQIISETEMVYRSEYLAYQLFEQTARQKLLNANGELAQLVQNAAASRYQEAYTKGVHDEDAVKILAALVQLSTQIDLLCFTPDVRACANLFWNSFLDAEQKKLFQNQLKSAGVILQVFPETHGFDFLINDLATAVLTFQEQTELFAQLSVRQVATYLFRELSRADEFVISPEAAALQKAFLDHLQHKKSVRQYEDSVVELRENRVEQFELIRKWVHAFLEQSNMEDHQAYLEETATLLLLSNFSKDRVIQAKSVVPLEELRGSHPLIEAGNYQLDYHAFMQKMEHHQMQVVPHFEAFQSLKKQLTTTYKKQLRLDDFKPRVLSSFVRNKLIDQVYLPIFGDNLAKQIGTADENTRTDRMGMLLLISPPGYGKTTLMEYIADRLGLIFMKINGPTLGHQVVSLDPSAAPNMACRQELEKLNLALEMGNNVMLYLDDIQHCHPEFLQKFISLCDAQRKIEGVFAGESKTYDLRGKRICVVMAGNPYTESGDKFQIPDMLANRADIYNLGDIIGDSAEVFKLSYIENALT
ncbi:MAG: DNA repair ATPase, partial [Bacteroidota bacterium]